MIYFKFAGLLLVASCLFPIIYSIFSLPLLAVAAGGVKLYGENGEPRPWIFRAVAWLLFAILGIGTIYIFGGWAAYVAFRTSITTLKPQVIHDWLYYLTGFTFCHAPLGYMASKDPDGKNSCFMVAVAMAAYVVFCIWPGLAMAPYGWFLARLFNIQTE